MESLTEVNVFEDIKTGRSEDLQTREFLVDVRSQFHVEFVTVTEDDFQRHPARLLSMDVTVSGLDAPFDSLVHVNSAEESVAMVQKYADEVDPRARMGEEEPEKVILIPRSATDAGTPYYVLLESNRRIGPKVVQFPAGMACAPIYGFSDKGPYDQFCSNSQLALTPYPLVKVYLREQAGTPGDGLKLVVVDAAGPCEPYLHAATMAAVLEAQENHTTHVTAGYRLIFDQEADAYRLEEACA